MTVSRSEHDRFNRPKKRHICKNAGTIRTSSIVPNPFSYYNFLIVYKMQKESCQNGSKLIIVGLKHAMMQRDDDAPIQQQLHTFTFGVKKCH